MSSAVTAPPTSDSSANSIWKTYAPAFLWIAGLIMVLITLILQIFTLNHGTSGQLSIDTGIYAGIWWPIIGATILALFYTIWILLKKDEMSKFIYLFVLVFLSYLLSNVALFLSTRQVKVSTT